MIAVGTGYIAATRTGTGQPDWRTMAAQAAVSPRVVTRHLQAIREIDPDLLEATDARGDALNAEFAARPAWSDELEELVARRHLRPRFLVARELLACAYRGEAMPSDEVLAGLTGVPAGDVPRLIDRLGKEGV
jgi:hypothetical protein